VVVAGRPLFGGALGQRRQRLVEPTLALRLAEELDLVDQDLLRGRLLRELRGDRIGERLQRHIAGAVGLSGRQVGLDARRGQFDDLHLAVQLGAQRQGVGVDRRLGRRIGRRGDQRHEGEAGGDVDDRRVRLAAQMIDQRVGQADRAEHVDRQRGFRVGQVAAAGQILELHDAGIVEQDVERREVGDDPLGKGVNRCSVLDVERDGMDTLPAGCRAVQRVLAAAGDDDGVAAIVETMGERFADAAAAAGHQNGVATGLHGRRLRVM